MAVAAYKYVSDDGVTYQVILPTDFAAALSYVAAVGTETYLPSFISPRYASYTAAGSNLFRQAVVPSRSTFVSPPTPVTVGGITYRLQDLQGEARAAVPSGNFQTIAGPQGAPGADAPPYVPNISVFTGSFGTFSNTTTQTAINLGTLVAGNYIAWCTAGYASGTLTTNSFVTVLLNNTDSAQLGRSDIQANKASVQWTNTFVCYFTLAASKALLLTVQQTVSNAASNNVGTAVLWRYS